jgi:hypothetical protein
MEIDNKLYEIFHEKAKNHTIEKVYIGLRYTAVTTADGGIGLSFTYSDPDSSCLSRTKYVDYENKTADLLLENIFASHPLRKTMALALINALNYKTALSFPEDRENRIMFDVLDVRDDCRVAMVGYFKPFVQYFKKRNTPLTILDESRKIGDTSKFYENISSETDVLFVTSTSILNDTLEEILFHAGSGIKTVLLGPSTPMVKEAFSHLPVTMLAGTVPLDKEGVLKAVCHGYGTNRIHRFSRKSYILL